MKKLLLLMAVLSVKLHWSLIVVLVALILLIYTLFYFFWNFLIHTTCFDYIYPEFFPFNSFHNFPFHSLSFQYMYSLLRTPSPRWCFQFMPDCGTICTSMGSLSGNAPLKKTRSPSLRSHQLSSAQKAWFQSPPWIVLGFWVASSCVGLVPCNFC